MDISVLHVAQPTDAGVAVVAAQLAAQQLSRGWSVAVACPPFEPEPADGPRRRTWLSRTAAAAGARVLDWEATRSPGRSTMAEAGRLRELIREVNPDLVHLHSSKAGLAGRLALRGGLPTIFQPHAWSFEAVTGPTRTAALYWERWATRWTDLTVCVSAREQQDGERAGVRGRFAVVPNGVDPEVYTPGARTEARARLGLPDDGRPLALVLGRLCPQKGQDQLLDVWPAVLGQVPEARLALVGDGPDREKLAAMVQADPALAGSVLLAGATEDPLSWYRAADLLVVPSRWEGMALAPLEAMSCGCPVVAFEVAGIRECLPPQWAGWALAAPGDGARLAELVARRLAGAAQKTEETDKPSGNPETRVVTAGKASAWTHAAGQPSGASEASRTVDGAPMPDKRGTSAIDRLHQTERPFAVQARDWVLGHHSFTQTADSMADCYCAHLGTRRARLQQASNL
jgi:glycosyltransferase involved in cell wall biosynthesis